MPRGNWQKVGRTEAANIALLTHATSNVTDENEEPLARSIPRRDLLSKVTGSWSRTREETKWSRGYEALMIGGMQGLYRRLPERSSYVLKNRRQGTMCEEGENNVLAVRTEDIRMRHEHVEKRIITLPMLEDLKRDGRRKGLGIVREAFLSELRDLYTIVSSMEARKFDLRAQDVLAMFEWFKMFENFVRIYLMCSEKVVYAMTMIDHWGGLTGVLAKGKRLREKQDIILLCECVEGMKRRMIAKGEKCGLEMEVLRDRSDELTMRLMQYLNEEWRQMPCKLESKLNQEEMDGVFEELVKSIRGCVHGREMVMLMSVGLDGGNRERLEWARGWCGGLTGMGVQMWMRRFMDRHGGYVVAFRKANEEYGSMYRNLGKGVDEKIRQIHEEW